MYDKNISEDRRKYLRKIKKEKISVILTQLLILIMFIVGWEILANKGIIDSFITSQPSRILDTFLNLSANRTTNSFRSNINRNPNRICVRCYFRSIYSNFTMVVSVFFKSIRTILSCIKQFTKSSASDRL